MAMGHETPEKTAETYGHLTDLGPVIERIDEDVRHLAARTQDAATAPVYVVHTPAGFTETFGRQTIETLERLGLIRHERDGHVLEDGQGNGVGPLHRFYCEASR